MMKRTFTSVACIAALALTACTGDSSFPVATGEGTIRGINAIPGSPTVTFRIEERSLGGLTYKNSSSPATFDNFSYNFNFEIQGRVITPPSRIPEALLCIGAAIRARGDVKHPEAIGALHEGASPGVIHQTIARALLEPGSVFWQKAPTPPAPGWPARCPTGTRRRRASIRPAPTPPLCWKIRWMPTCCSVSSPNATAATRRRQGVRLRRRISWCR